MSQTPVPAPEFHPEWDKAITDTFASLKGHATRIEESLGLGGETLLERDLAALEQHVGFKLNQLRTDKAGLEAQVGELKKSIAALS